MKTTLDDKETATKTRELVDEALTTAFIQAQELQRNLANIATWAALEHDKSERVLYALAAEGRILVRTIQIIGETRTATKALGSGHVAKT